MLALCPILSDTYVLCRMIGLGLVVMQLQLVCMRVIHYMFMDCYYKLYCFLYFQATLAYDQSIKTDKNESRLKILEESHRTMQHDLLENFKTMQSEQRAERQQIIELQQHLDEQRKLEDARRREDQAKLQQQQNKLEEQQQMLREQQRILDDLRQQHRQPQPELQGQPQPQGLRQGLPQGQPQIQVPPQRQEQPQQKKSSSCTLL